MAEEKKKRKSGYSYLRAKIAKQEEELTQLKAENAKLKSDLNLLQNERNVAVDKGAKDQHALIIAKSQIETLKKQLDLAIFQMGWLRRLIYHY